MVPPDPIPNSEVKRTSADGSVASPCESRSLPGTYYSKRPKALSLGAFCFFWILSGPCAPGAVALPLRRIGAALSDAAPSPLVCSKRACPRCRTVPPSIRSDSIATPSGFAHWNRLLFLLVVRPGRESGSRPGTPVMQSTTWLRCSTGFQATLLTLRVRLDGAALRVPALLSTGRPAAAAAAVRLRARPQEHRRPSWGSGTGY